jgi:hypothetical protein
MPPPNPAAAQAARRAAQKAEARRRANALAKKWGSGNWNSGNQMHRPPRVNPGGNGPGRPPPPRPPIQSAEDWANALAEKRVQAEIDAIRAQQSAYEGEMQANYQRRLQQAKGLSEYIAAQGFDKRIQGIYSAAGSDLAGLASGFAGDTRDIANQDAADQMNMLSGTGQEGAVRNQGTNMGDVTYGVGGWIPSKSLGEQGAAYAADAAMQPAFTLQYGMEDASKILQEGQAGLSEFALAIAEAKAGKYSYSEKLLDDRRESSLAQQKFRLDQLESDRNFWLDRQALYLSQKKYKLAKQAEQRANALSKRMNYESAGRDAWGNPMPGYTVGKNGTLIPPGYKVDKNGNVVKQYAPSSSKNGSKYTPVQQASMVETIVGKEDEIKGMIAKAVKAGEWYVGSGPSAPGSRKKLADRLFKEFRHLAGTYKPALARLRQLINRLLFEAERAGVSGTGATGSGTIVIPPAGG